MPLIIGPGAVGTAIAGYIGATGQHVRVLGRPEDLEALCTAPAVVIERVTGGPPIQAPKPEIATDAVLHAGEIIFLCVKQRDLDSVLDALPRPMPANITLVITLNGAGALRALRARFPDQAVIAASILFNAQWLEPLHVRVSARPRIQLAFDDPRIPALFAGSGISLLRAHGERTAWGRLLLSLGHAICAVTDTSLRGMLLDTTLRRIYADAMQEGYAVLRASGIDCDLPIGIPVRAYLLLLRSPGTAAWHFTRWRLGLSAGSTPSMVSDIRHGLPTEVDDINGEIGRLATRMNIPAPVNNALAKILHSLERMPAPAYLDAKDLARQLHRATAVT